MKQLSLILGLFLSLHYPSLAQAQTLPSAQEVGTLFGNYMCQSLVKTGSMGDDKMMEEFVTNLIDKYGEENTAQLMNKLEGVFEKDKLGNDRYGLELMRGALNQLINNDSCFQVFVNEIF